MSTTSQPTHERSGARPAPDRDETRRFAGRVKRWSLGLAVVGFGLGWGLVSQNVVGATNAAATNTGGTNAGTPAGGGAPAGTPGRATAPSPDFFGQPATQPQPVFGSGADGSGGAPVVRGRTS
jgi:hypothetical protein